MKIVSARSLGTVPVYDLSVDHPSHSFVHSSGAIVHNCAYLICDEPISNFIPLTTVGGVKVTQFTAGPSEEAGALKYDFLVINSLKDVSDAIKLIQNRQGFTSKEAHFLNGKKVPHFRIVPFNGNLYDIWDLPEDLKVFGDISRSEVETVFQFDTNSAKQWLNHFNHVKAIEPDGQERMALDSIEALSAFTALDRPGPLDAYVSCKCHPENKHNMLVEYAQRARGKIGRAHV